MYAAWWSYMLEMQWGVLDELDEPRHDGEKKNHLTLPELAAKIKLIINNSSNIFASLKSFSSPPCFCNDYLCVAG